MKKVIIYLMILLFSSFSSWAEVKPRSGTYEDERLTDVVYNPNQVVRIDTYYGVATALVFHENERVLSAAVGDSEAWEIEASDNVVFVKPIAEMPMTNLHIKTNLRLYHFLLDLADGESKNVAFRISFKYPEYERQLQAQKNKRATSGKSKPIIINFDPLKHFQNNRHKMNTKYFTRGSATLKPSMVYDDNNHTYVLMKQTQVRPAVYAINASGKESLVNRTDKGNWIVVQGIYKKIRLRAEGTVIEIMNDNYDPTLTNFTPPPTNPFKRLLKK